MVFFDLSEISLLPTISKVLEKLIIKKINKDLNPPKLDPKGSNKLTPQCNNATA